MNYYTKPRKSNTYWQYFFILIAFSCCVVKIWNTEQNSQGIWANNLFYFLYTKAYIYKWITSILLIINTFSVILFLRRFSFLEFRNYTPAILYLLFCFIFSNTLTLWGMATGVFILWGILPYLFGLKDDNINTGTFMYGLSCGILSLIYPPFLALLFFLYIAIFMGRHYRIRAFILPIIGTSLAYLYLFSGFYLLDNTDMIPVFFEMIKSQMLDIQLSIDTKNGGLFIFFLIASILLGCVSFFKIWKKTLSFTVNKRKKYIFLLIILFFQSIFTLFFHSPHHLFTQTMLILFVILLSISMSFMKKTITYKLIFFVLFFIALGYCILVMIQGN